MKPSQSNNKKTERKKKKQKYNSDTRFGWQITSCSHHLSYEHWQYYRPYRAIVWQTHYHSSESVWLPNNASIFRAELYAIMLAMRLLRERKENNFIIFSDSMSSLQAFSGLKLELDLIQKILKDYSHRVFTYDVQFDHLSSPLTFQLQTRTRTPSCIAFSSTATLTWVCCMSFGTSVDKNHTQYFRQQSDYT